MSFLGLCFNIGHGLFVEGWVEHPDIFCWVSFLYPTYLPAIFVLSAKPNKMAEDKSIPHFSISIIPQPLTHQIIHGSCNTFSQDRNQGIYLFFGEDEGG